jgi:hypothetical protein
LKSATKNAIAAELAELSGATLSQALIALEQTGEDRYAAYSFLKEEKQSPRKELKESENLWTGEFGPILDNYLWSAKPYSQMGSTEGAQPELNLSAIPPPAPTWYAFSV